MPLCKVIVNCLYPGPNGQFDKPRTAWIESTSDRTGPQCEHLIEPNRPAYINAGNDEAEVASSPPPASGVEPAGKPEAQGRQIAGFPETANLWRFSETAKLHVFRRNK